MQRIRALTILLLPAVACGLASAVQAQTIWYVDDDAPEGGDGLNWERAFKYLQDALSAADHDPNVSEIRVGQGIYTPDQDEAGQVTPGDRQATFQLISGVAVYGGYGADDPDERDVALYEAILSGDIGTPDDPSDNSYHVVTGSGVDESAALDGVTVTAGNADGPYPDSHGGGMYNAAGSPTLIHCTFSGNSANYDAAIYNRYSNPTLTHCTFSDNSAYWGAGGMYNYHSSPMLTNCTFSGNHRGGMHNSHSSPTLTNCTFSGNSGNNGGGMYSYNHCNPALTHCTFSGNSASYRGGGMYSGFRSSPTLTDCTFTDNSAGEVGGGMCSSSGATLTDCTFSGNSTEGKGGGMYSGGASPTLTNCAFSENSAAHGGAVYCSGSSPLLIDCTFGENSASYLGGGICCWSGVPTLANCAFTGNQADNGGGLYSVVSSPALINCTFSGNSASKRGGGVNHWGAAITLTNCTFSGNSAGLEGGGMRNANSALMVANCTFSGNTAGDFGSGIYSYNLYSSPTLVNCVIWHNLPDEVFEHGPASLVIYSCIKGGWVGEGNLDADPLFVDPDGPDDDPNTWADNDYRLSAGSPCIDAADNEAVPADEYDLDDDGDTLEPIPFDLDGNPRFVDDPDTADTGVPDPDFPDLPIVDMGAYEFQACAGDVDCDGDTDHADLGILLADWGCVGSEPEDCPGDLDGDFDTDHSDLGILLADWGCGT